MKKQLDIKKLLILNLPYLLMGLFATNFGEAWRMVQGADASQKALSLISVLPVALASWWPSLHPLDLLVGLCCGAGLRLAVYLKSKNAKKYRHGMEYGSARWGTHEDIAPYVDPVFQNNVILTKTESLTMNSRPKDPKTARNKNVLVIGGSGSGKTRFWLKPNLMQMHSSYVVTDPKGTILVECGKMLQRGTPKMRPKLGKDHQPVKDRHGNPVYETVKDKNGKVVYEPYRIKVLNTINFKKSIENHLREKDYSFDYAKQPSKAMFKYRKAFLRNDGERYNAFLEAVSSGEKQLHADNLAPYEIVRSALNADRWGFHADLTVGEKAALNASWASLPDFCDNRNALAVVDTSGSMYCYDNALPAAVALSLGLYFGERNTGIFHNHFIEFSSRPQLIEIKGKTFAERLEYLCTFNEVADTNVEAVFDLILDAAVRNNVPQEELPETLYLISDMEFNACVRNASVSNFASAKRRFAECGYKLPQIVFWNVASRNSNQPVTKNEQGVALVSGCTPRLFSMVASGDLSPYSVMMEIIESERYAKISA